MSLWIEISRISAKQCKRGGLQSDPLSAGIVRAVLAITLLIVAGCTPGSQTGQKSVDRQDVIEVGAETTWLLGPVTERGTIDYAAYWVQRSQIGTGVEANALVPLARAIGPEVLPKRCLRYVFQYVTAQEYFTYPREDGGESSVAIALSELLDPLRVWTDEKHPHVAQWIREQERYVDLFLDAADKPAFYVPLREYDGGFDVVDSWPRLVDVYTLGRVVAIDGARLLGRQKHEEAWERVMALLRVGHLLSMGPSGLVSRTISQQLRILGYKLALLVARQRHVSDGLRTACLRDLRSIPDLLPLDDVVLKERFVALDVVQTSAAEYWRSTWPNQKVELKVNRVLREINRWYDTLEVEFRRANLRTSLPEVKAILGALNLRIDRAEASKCGKGESRNERLALRILAELSPAMDVAITDELEQRAYRNLAVVTFAIETSRAITGSYPLSLAELELSDAAEVIADPFADGPLRYSRVAGGGYALYSVGRDEDDDSGARGDDIVVRRKP